jgi:hypothetical protein
MIHPRHFASALVVAMLGTVTATAHAQQNTVPPQAASPAVLQSLQAVQELAKVKRNEEALAKLRELDARPNKTADEEALIARTRIAIAMGSENAALRNRELETAMASGTLPADVKIQVSQVLSQSYYNEKQYPKAIEWLTRYFKEGGKDEGLRDYLALSYYMNNDFARAAQEVKITIQAAEAAGKVPSETQLRMLASSAKKLNDKAMQSSATEKYVAYYPKKELWADLLGGVLSKPNFPDRLALDVFRLMHATGQITTAKAYADMAQLAMVSGYPAEAEKVLNEGFKSGVLGKGAEAAKHRQLRDSAARSAANETRELAAAEVKIASSKKANELVDTGFAYVGRGQYDKGIAMMEEGLRLGGLKKPEESKLHLGVAYAFADQKEKAIETFKTVKGSDGTGDIARYWTLHLAGAGNPALAASSPAAQSSGDTGTAGSSSTSQPN